MKKLPYSLLMAVFPAFLIAATINNQPEIKLTAAKDRVIPIKQRTFILEAAKTYLNRSNDLFADEIMTVNNPYSSGTPPTVADPEPSIVVYDDASILELIQKNFAQQVRGTLAKGATYYLQLKGGGMLGAGDHFPVQIPQIEGESFTIIILEITPDGYTLKMNDVIKKATFEKTSGVIKNSAK